MALAVPERDAFQRSTIELVVPNRPFDSNLKYEDVSSLQRDQRQHVYYDEIIQVLVLVRSSIPSERLQHCLNAGHLSVSAHLAAFPTQHGPQPGAPDEPSIKLVLDSVSDSAASPLLIHSQSSESAVAVFRTELHLQHPERPLSRPQLSFAASLVLDLPSHTTSDPFDDYLPSGIPMSSNLLSPLLTTPDLAGSNLRLPASRLEKVVPVHSATHNDIRPVRGGSQALPLYSALLLKTSRTLFPDHVYLSIAVHIPESARAAVQIERVEGRIPSSNVSSLSTIPLPATMKAGDRTTFIFRSEAKFGTSVAQFRIGASLKLPSVDSINLLIRRTLNAPPQAKVPTRDRVKQWSTPKGASRPNSTIAGPREAPGEAMRRGLKISISAPDRIEVGQVFKVNFFILNSSARKRRLALLGPPVGTNHPAHSRAGDRTSWTIGNASDSMPKPHKGNVNSANEDLAQAVTELKQLYLQATGGKQGDRRKSTFGVGGQGPVSHRHKAEIIPIDTDVKIGTLQPGACHEVSMKIRAISVGVVNIEGIVVVDLDSRETCLIGEGWEGLCFASDDD